MIPLVQMHQMVQPPPLLDPLASFQAHLKPEFLSFQNHHHASSTPRSSNPYHQTRLGHAAVPIRSSQPGQPLGLGLGGHVHPPPAVPSDHTLRRKTPNGTIANGYDGAIANLAAGPPPQKHMILSTPSKIFPTAVVQRAAAAAAAAGTSYSPPAPPPVPWSFASTAAAATDTSLGDATSTNAMVGGWVPGRDPLGRISAGLNQAALVQPQQQLSYHSASRMQTVFVPAYQQNASPTVFSPNPINQPLNYRSLSDYRAAVPVATGYVPHNVAYQYDGAFIAAQATLQHGLANPPSLGPAQPFGLPQSARALDDGFSRHAANCAMLHSPHRRMEALSLNSATGPVSPLSAGDIPSPARFKERALAQAHKAYGDLLLYLTHTKKSQHGKSRSGSRTSSNKMVVYPKPPKQPSASLAGHRPRLSHSFTDPSANFPHHAQNHHHQAKLAHSFAGARVGVDASGRVLGAPSTIAAEIFGVPHGGAKYANGPKLHRSHSLNVQSPLLNAKASLEMLNTLCEQSGWKWVDGMLLGGCLHYGLEHHDAALEWFRRITHLDSHHVEAISNIAATLYCLNRQQEAEKHWQKAINIRPGYLEAVEHLVGLLCSSHRNQEAVNIIENVQRRLRVTESRPLRDSLNETSSETDKSSTSSGSESSPLQYSPNVHQGGSEFAPTNLEVPRQPGFGSSGYAIPGSENSRMLLLVHAKGNMLYALKEVERASAAFEEAVLISTGRKFKGIQTLIREIQRVLRPGDAIAVPSRSPVQRVLSTPLLLPPERAKLTAQFVFAATKGHLPGLRFLGEGSHLKSAISTTSNSLLSLAKIFQDGISSGGCAPVMACQPSGVGDILALYYLSLSLQESPSTANNVGILLASVQQLVTQHTSPTESAVTQSIPGITPGSGLALALQYYNYGLTLDPKHVHLHTNLGSLLKDIGQLDLAIQMYEQAVACDGTFDIALTNLANAVKDRGRISDAIMYYRRAVKSNPDFAEAVCGLSTALNSVCDWAGRGGVYLDGGKHDRWHVDEDGMLKDVQTDRVGSGLMKKVVDIVERQLKDASSWGHNTLQGGYLVQLLSHLKDAGAAVTDPGLNVEAKLGQWAGQPWEGSRLLRLIERSTRAAMRCWYRDLYVHGRKPLRAYARPRPPTNLTVPTAPTVLPFHTFTCPLTARDIRMISQRNALRISSSTLKSPWLPSTVYRPPKPPSPHLNIGYVSSDFNNHPLAHLMQSVFGFHDKSRAKAFCYATTAGDRSVHRQQIEREAPVFRDVSSWSSEKLVEQIVEDGIHILVNLNGYTRGARNEIFAARPAPIQMSFMGFAGTLGAEWCDYILADTTAIPPSTLRPYRDNLRLEDVFRDEAEGDSGDWVYSENIIFCRDTFFCCDHAQSADATGERNMSWEDEQRRRWKMRKELFPDLPDDAVLLGNFNQLYKIDPTTFRTWLRILASVPNAYLWLLRFPELGETHLKKTARMWAGEQVASRILFTDVAPKQQHISRARVCDLFLDTPECNAHTTAADVLWSSTPLVTLPRYRYKMCSRMAASILRGALPQGPRGDRAADELIADDDEMYEQLAIELARSLTYRIRGVHAGSDKGGGYGAGAGRLFELRKMLWESKWTCALFDTHRWVRDLEDAYDEAWRRWVEGVPGDIYL